MPTRLLVQGATSFLAFAPGQPGGTTNGVLRSMGNRALLGVQRFPVRRDSAEGRVVVLAPLETGGPPARIRQLRLISE